VGGGTGGAPMERSNRGKPPCAGPEALVSIVLSCSSCNCSMPMRISFPMMSPVAPRGPGGAGAAFSPAGERSQASSIKGAGVVAGTGATGTVAGAAGAAPRGGDQPGAEGADSQPHADKQRTCAV